MPSLRNVLILATLVAAMALPTGHAFAQRGGGRGGGGRGGGGNRNNGNNNPTPQRPNAQQDPTVVADRTEITTIQTEINSTQTKVDEASKKITKDFQQTQEYIDAQKALESANTEVQSARDAALSKLKETPEYKAAATKEAAARAKLEQMRQNGASRDAVADQAKVILVLGGVTSKMERDALAADSPYGDAQKKLAEAQTAVKSLKDKLAEQIKNDEDVKTLQQTITDDRTKLADAQKKYTTDLATASGH